MMMVKRILGIWASLLHSAIEPTFSLHADSKTVTIVLSVAHIKCWKKKRSDRKEGKMKTDGHLKGDISKRGSLITEFFNEPVAPLSEWDLFARQLVQISDIHVARRSLHGEIELDAHCQREKVT